MRAEQVDSFRAFAASAIPSLRRTALGMTGDPHPADDLVQQTLERMYAAWPRIESGSAPLAYARKTLVHSLIDDKRRWWRRAVTLTDDLPDAGTLDARIEAVGADASVRTALATLSRRQRLVVLLRHVEGLSVTETAAATGLTEANVKAATREGLAALRAALTHDDDISRKAQA